MRATTFCAHRLAAACLATLGACLASAAEPTSGEAAGASLLHVAMGRVDYALATSATPGLRICDSGRPAADRLLALPACNSGGIRPTSGVGFWARERALRTARREAARPLDANRFLVYLKWRALPLHGAATCARHVREALEAAGFNAAGHPRRAKDWGPLLHRMGFASIDASSYLPARGDVVVFEPKPGHPDGHIQAYDGTAWISDFVQPQGFWPSSAYRGPSGRFTPYRHARS